MATLKELESAFIQADKAGNTEDATIFADALRKHAPRKQKEEGARGFAPFFARGVTTIAGAPMDILSKGASLVSGRDIELPGGRAGLEEGIKAIPGEIADTLGIPIDAIASGLNLIPGVNIKKPFGGSESFRGALEPFTPVFPDKGQKAKTIPEHIGQVTGETAAALLPQAAIFKVLAGGTSLVSKIAADFNKLLVRHPVTALTSEETAAVAAGTARGLLEEGKVESPAIRAGVEVAAGLAGGFAPIVAINTPTALAVRHGVPILKKVLFPLGKAGSTIRAKQGVQGEIGSPLPIVFKRLDEPTITPLPPAVKSGDKRIIGMYKTLLSKDPVKETEAIEQTARNIIKLEGEMRKLGYGSNDLLIDVTEARVKALETSMNKRILDATNRVNIELNKIPKADRRSAEAIIVNRELRKGKSIATLDTQKAWNNVNMALEVDVDNIRNRFSDLIAKVAPDQRKTTIPGVLKSSRITKLAKFETAEGIVEGPEFDFDDIVFTVLDLQGLRSELLRTARVATKNGNHAKSWFANEMADAALADLEAIANVSRETITPDIAKLRYALASTKKMRRKFGSGIIGKILGVEQTGVPAIDPTLTLDISLGRQGIKGAVDLKKLVVSPEAKRATERYLGRSFTAHSTKKSGEIIPHKAKAWIDNNEDILDIFPDLRNKLSNATSAQDFALQTKATMEARKAALRDPKISQAAQLLNINEIQTETDIIMNSKFPVTSAAELMRKARNVSGEAVEGVRGGFVEWLLDKSYIGLPNELGEQTLSGSTLLANIKNSEKALNNVFTPDQINRMRVIGKELAKIEAFDVVSLSKKDIIELKDLPTTFLRTMSRIVGARIGGKVGKESVGGSLQMAQIASGNFQKLLNWMTRHSAEKMVYDAILSPDKTLLQALLLPINKPIITGRPANFDILTKRMNAYLISTGKKVMEDIENEERLNQNQ